MFSYYFWSNKTIVFKIENGYYSDLVVNYSNFLRTEGIKVYTKRLKILSINFLVDIKIMVVKLKFSRQKILEMVFEWKSFYSHKTRSSYVIKIINPFKTVRVNALHAEEIVGDFLTDMLESTKNNLRPNLSI